MTAALSPESEPRPPARRRREPRAAQALRALSALVLGVAVSDGLCSQSDLDCANCELDPSQPQCLSDTGIPEGAHCAAICQPGYKSSNIYKQDEYTCEDNRMRALPNPGGARMDCVIEHPTIPGGWPNYKCTTAPPCEDDGCEWASSCDGKPSAKCTAKCRAGYYSTLAASTVQYNCNGNIPTPHWEVVGHHKLVCQRACPNVPPHPHQHWRVGGKDDYNCKTLPHEPEDYTDEGFECKADCDEGYTWQSGSNKFCEGDYGSDSHEPHKNADDVGWYKCQNSGEWAQENGPPCLCTGVTCEEYEPLHSWDGHHHFCPAGHYHGADCEIKCDPPYARVGGSGRYRCGADKQWHRADPTEGVLQCKRTCPKEISARFSLPCEGDGYGAGHNRTLAVSGERCYARCAEGYVASTGAVYSCSGDGLWQREGSNGVEFSCVPEGDAKVCIASKPDKHMHFGSDCNCSAVGSECAADCDEGYEADNGEQTFMCDAAGRWVTKYPDDHLECRRPPTACPSGEALLVNPEDKRTYCTYCEEDDVREACRSAVDKKWLWLLPLLLAPLLYYAVYRCCPGCLPDCLAPARPGHKQSSVLRQTFLGRSLMMPAERLAEQDVAARWLLAEQQPSLRTPCGGSDDDDEDNDEDDDGGGSGDVEGGVGSGVHSGNSSSSSGKRRRFKMGGGGSKRIPVMFTGDHVRELQPRTWKTNPLGTGSYGIVYKAQWRGRDVAVKVLKLPQRGIVMTTAGEQQLKQRVEDVMQDFIDEIEVCCDLNHPNLARLVGYAERPTLMMVQELLNNSVDHMLYISCWRPTTAQVLKAALDVSKGMAYLHGAFEMQSNNHTQPIIHRDLKTPNLLLASDPLAGEGVRVKITDFGLSRDKVRFCRVFFGGGDEF
jgi:hypothetical protein